MGIENFEKLPCEKQTEIINAAIEVFGRNEYKRCPQRRSAAGREYPKVCCFTVLKTRKACIYMPWTI